MNNPLSYKELENLVKTLKSENVELKENLTSKESLFSSKEKFYEQIINHTNEGLAIVQGDVLKFVNQPALNLLKSTKSELEEKNFSDLIHPNYRGNLIIQISKIIEGEIPNFSSTIEVITKSSKVFSVRIYVEQILSNNNQATLIVKIEDAEELIRKQQEINNLKSALTLFENFSSEGVFVLQKPSSANQLLFKWNIIEVNNSITRILEKKRDDILNQPLGKFLIPDFDYSLPKELDESFFEELELYILNFKKHFKISVFWYAADKLVCRINDISDFVLTKSELNRNLQRNELITEILDIFNRDESYEHQFDRILDRVGYHFKPKRIAIIIKSENKKHGKIYSQWASNEFEKFPSDFLIPYQRVPSWNKMLEDRKMILGFSVKYLPDDIQSFLNTQNINNIYAFPIIISDNVFGSVLFENYENLEWDNTEINYLKMVSVLISSLIGHKVNEDNLRQAKDHAEESDRLKSSFLANMSHDIRIPMTSIIGFSDLLVDEDLSITEREEFVEMISKSGQDLLSLIDNIVDMAKIETCQLKLQTDKVLLPHLFKDLLNTHLNNSKIINQDDLDLVVDLPQKYENIHFETDVFRLKQVFDNLLENAIKFTEKGEVRFGISNIWSKTVEFYVHDTGIGIPEDTQHIIFKRFGKVDRSYTKEYSGTGLGLAICKNLVEIMGGEIRVISYPSKGSTFYFTHPLITEVSEEIFSDTPDDKKTIEYDWSGKTILIAEDVEQNYKFLEFLLDATKVNVVWAQNGKEALEYIRNENTADLILMDIRMPIMNGIEATRAIHKISSVPIIAQTAYTMGNEKDMAIQAGCVDYVSKPVNADNLLKLINDYLNK